MKMKLTPSLFALGLLLFALPFTQISCQGRHISITGAQLVAGGKIDGQKFHGTPIAAVAALFALGTTVMGFLKHERPERFLSIGGCIVTGLMLILPSVISSSVERESSGLGRSSMQPAYYLSLLAFGLGTAIAIQRWRGTFPATERA